MLCGCLYSLQLAADSGDKLVVNTNHVNLRQGPSSSYPVLQRVQQGQSLTEIKRYNEWVQVDTGDAGISPVWVHASLVDIVTMADAQDTGDRLPEQFSRAFLAYEQELETRLEEDYFATLRSPGNRVLELTVTESWIQLERNARNRILDDILGMWSAAAGPGPVTVDVVDAQGTRLLSIYR